MEKHSKLGYWIIALVVLIPLVLMTMRAMTPWVEEVHQRRVANMTTLAKKAMAHEGLTFNEYNELRDSTNRITLGRVVRDLGTDSDQFLNEIDSQASFRLVFVGKTQLPATKPATAPSTQPTEIWF
jgi:hypothetical protein